MSFNELFGSIPDGWRSCTLGELVKEFNGSIQTGPFGSQLHAADYVEDGIPSIMPKNIRIDGVDDSDIARVSPEDINRLSKYKVQTGDIVYSRRGDVEKCSLITEKENGWLCGTGCLRVRLQTEEVSPEFLHAYLCHPAVREWIVRHAVGATMPNLNTSILSALPVLVPTSDSMAAITSNWNALSSKLVINSKINQTLEQMAQAIFKSWFVDFDPVKAKMNGEQPEGMDAATASLFPEKLVESELGLIPEGWESKQLKDVLELAYGKALKKTDRVAGDVPVYGSGGLTGYHNQSLVEGPGIIVGRKGTVGSVYWEPRAFYPIDTVFYVKPRAGYSLKYCHLVLQNLGLKDMNTDAAVPGLNRNNAYRLDVVTPSEAILHKFEEIMQSFQLKVDANRAQNSNLESLRDTLLPKLLSGEVEL
ncbi:restriction endonuclease subunit S [Vibrio parahaemolyticus]|nr:restriction endonuclease subunit S [Vibrio parahaemolyticus]EHR0829819.1 restriction endonuclease subunit S [Vibrio parahaemolyticus]EHR1159224.1 restriction endonuclease subunit S [Vibrio parahaemolyticus]EHR5009435.1 restriction endonuclease subunit S [Vibrio parahaemolyticus]